MIALLIILILTSACFSGLTIGMFSISVDSLERKIKLGNKDAEKIFRVRKNGNFLLSTLLLGNVAVNSAISLTMSSVASGLIAGVVSTVLIFIFGEVIPQALFSKHAFAVGARTTWLVRIFMFIMWPIAKPLSMILDMIFGKGLTERYDKSELELILDDHVENSIDSDEKRIMVGAMNFSDKTTIDVITPVNVLFALECNTIVDESVINQIKDQNYSRIPVYEGERDNIIGVLFAKNLLGYDPKEKLAVKDLCVKGGVICVGEDYPLDSLLNMFIKSKKHISFIYNQFHTLTGIVTLEDIIETILSIEILDEGDTVSDLQHLAKSYNKVKLTTKEVLID
jgi:metal transporter CNNM